MRSTQKPDSNSTNKNHDNITIPEFAGVVLGSSRCMSELYTIIRRVAVTDYPILITGETGSGKEVAATLIHHFSNRESNLFVDVNCGSIPEALIESHLFGHEQGAFTGAVNKHLGYFSTVGSGTLFLDEIAELPLQQQTKLLRVLETRTFRPVGSTKCQPFTGRIIAATHQNLEKMVAEKKFREDLYYRINVFHLKVPSLKERQEDIPALVNYFSRQKRQPFDFTRDAIIALSKADWPGNIRQLKNTIDKIAVLCDENPVSLAVVKGYIQGGQEEDINDVLESIARSIINLNLKNKREMIERTVIKQVLSECSGNKSKAANMLGVHRKYIERRLKSFNCDLDQVLNLIHTGKKEMLNSQYSNAIVCYKKAISLLDSYTNSVKVDTLRLELLVKLGVCIRTLSGWNDPELNNIYKEAEMLGAKLNKIDEIATVQFGIWVQHLMNLELDKGLVSAEKLRVDGENVRSPFVISQSYIAFANLYFWRGEHRQTKTHLELFVNLFQHGNELLIDSGQDPFVFYQMFLALNSFHMGDIQKAITVLNDFFVYVDKINHPFATVIALQTGAWLEYMLGNFERSYTHAAHLIDLSGEHSFLFYEGLGMIFRGAWISSNINPDAGINEIKSGYNEKMLYNGGCAFNSMFALILGTVYLMQERYVIGVELVDRAIKLSQEKNEICYLSDLITLHGKFSILDSNIEQAKQEFEQARQIAIKTGSLPAELKAGIALASLDNAFESTAAILMPIVSKFPANAHYADLDNARLIIDNCKTCLQCQDMTLEVVATN